MLHVKDMMIEMRKHPLKKGDVRQMLRQPFFIPETKEADELFRIMQETRHHMALLVDEYGGFSGIVTIENLVEEIMGDINEEYEEVVPEIECVREDEYKIDGGVLIDDLNDELGLKLETEIMIHCRDILLKTGAYSRKRRSGYHRNGWSDI